MNKDFIITVAIAIVFVVTGLFAIFNTGVLVNLAIDKVIGVEDCRYGVEKPVLVEDRDATTTPETTCTYDTNRAKRDAARAVAIILVTAPVAYFTYRRLRV